MTQIDDQELDDVRLAIGPDAANLSAPKALGGCPVRETRHPVFRTNPALHHDLTRERIDPERVAADWGLMYDWLRRDEELAYLCGFGAADVGELAEASRIAELRREVGPLGRHFTVLPAEMQFWVRFSWINAERCSGRQHALQHAVVRYLPEVESAADMLRAAVEHARIAMRAPLAPQTVVTVLGPPAALGSLGQLFVTEQLLRPAGYRRVDGTWRGDGGYVDLTEWVGAIAPELIDPTPGYRPGTFDTLPMAAVGRDGDLALGTCPPGNRYLVDIPWPQHPDADDLLPLPGQERFACWPAIPLQTNFTIDIAGQQYCTIFNGWYVDEEIAANFLDPKRFAWVDRVSAAIHAPHQLDRFRHTDRLDEYRQAQVEIATLRAVRNGFKSARRRVSNVGPSQSGFGKFWERYVRSHGEAPPNDTGWTANRFGSRYRHPSHAMPHVPQTRGARLGKHWLTFRSLHPALAVEIVDLGAGHDRTADL